MGLRHRRLIFRDDESVRSLEFAGLILAVIALGFSAWRWGYAYGASNYRMIHGGRNPAPGSLTDRYLRAMRWVFVAFSAFFAVALAVTWLNGS